MYRMKNMAYIIIWYNFLKIKCREGFGDGGKIIDLVDSTKNSDFFYKPTRKK